jgi:riboflavin synthase
LAAPQKAVFVGIVQGLARVEAVDTRPGLSTLRLSFAPGFGVDLQVGASVSVDGLCLTVTRVAGERTAYFDVMQQSLQLTTLSELLPGSLVNVERAARDGAEIGGHPLSGHVDFQATLLEIRRPENNHVLRFNVPAPWTRYVFAKGYIAVGGASLTVAEVDRQAGWFEVWLIPETLRVTNFGDLEVGARVNVEIERGTQIVVDTIRDALDERLGPLLPALEEVLRQSGLNLADLSGPTTPVARRRP